MNLLHRPLRAGAVAVAGLALTAMSGGFAASAASAAATTTRTSLVTISPGVPAGAATVTGHYRARSMSVEVALAPRDAAGLARALRAAYTPGSASYHHWLSAGRFAAAYAPSPAAVTRYLHAAGLAVSATGSPFLIRVSGSSARIAAAFGTSLATYRTRAGQRFYGNAAAVRMPRSIAGQVLGVVGLNSAFRAHSASIRPVGGAADVQKHCDTPYPTRTKLYGAVIHGKSFAYGYGDGPGCAGLTPDQDNSLYGAPNLGRTAKGAGVNLALFELSAYQTSDIETWAHTFYGPGYSPKLENVIVDGGPLHPQCPKGDSCPPAIEKYAGDIEINADIEMDLSIAPQNAHIVIYNAPNDVTGQTELDEYSKIAEQDTTSVVSSSWASCEGVESAGYVRAENVVFEQMAMQGQSMFSSAGDTGAFSCIRSNGSTGANPLDPASQPWVTGVGGTSFEHFNPGADKTPSYPAGTESVWNVDGLCNTSANEGGTKKNPIPGTEWCALTGAGGGAPSQFWGQPFYQHGPGVISKYTTHANGSTQCVLAKKGTPCRETPDVSANADPYTGYAEYCTGSKATPHSVCATIAGHPAGWFGIGGTSLSSPLWSAIIADRDGYTGARTGNINPMVYDILRTDASKYFHDIVATSSSRNNGLFPSTPAYDMATGIGSPKMTAFITGK